MDTGGREVELSEALRTVVDLVDDTQWSTIPWSAGDMAAVSFVYSVAVLICAW